NERASGTRDPGCEFGRQRRVSHDAELLRHAQCQLHHHPGRDGGRAGLDGRHQRRLRGSRTRSLPPAAVRGFRRQLGVPGDIPQPTFTNYFLTQSAIRM
ncbi:hypothetical protein BV898_20152, partial [Hypsibius exemplaris]